MRRALITAGGTREPVDDVRYLANMATGTLPAAMAEALLARGWHVDYLHGPGAERPGEARVGLSLLDAAALDAQWQAVRPALAARAEALRGAAGRCVLHPVATAAEAAEAMARLCRTQPPALVVAAMAVADYAPERNKGKVPSRGADGASAPWTLTLTPTAKVVDVVRVAAPGARLLAFKFLSGASEAEHVAAAARLGARAGADWVFSNDLRDYGAGRRCGTLRAGDGAALVTLDGGEGADAGARLAEALVAAVLAALSDGGGAPSA